MRWVHFCALVFCGITTVSSLRIVYEAIKTHDPIMLEVAREANNEAHWLFMKECTRKNSLKDCQNVK